MSGQYDILYYHVLLDIAKICAMWSLLGCLDIAGKQGKGENISGEIFSRK